MDLLSDKFLILWLVLCTLIILILISLRRKPKNLVPNGTNIFKDYN
jgi:hypothetical protein